MTTGLPANCERLTGLPLTSFSVQLGAVTPATLPASRMALPGEPFTMAGWAFMALRRAKAR